MELLSEVALEGLAEVLTFGARKYGPDNWRKGMEWRRLIGAALRHLMAFSRGEDVDPESGLPHIDHLACCAMFLSEYQKRKLGRDDRFRQDGDDLPDLHERVAKLAAQGVSFLLQRVDGWSWTRSGTRHGPFDSLAETIRHAEANCR